MREVSRNFAARQSDRDRPFAATEPQFTTAGSLFHAVQPLPDIGQMTMHYDFDYDLLLDDIHVLNHRELIWIENVFWYSWTRK